MKIRFITVAKVKCILYLKYREGICTCISNTLLMDVFVIVLVIYWVFVFVVEILIHVKSVSYNLSLPFVGCASRNF